MSFESDAQTPPDANSLVRVGELKKPYGIKGWLWVFSELETHSDIFTLAPWWIKTAAGFKPLEVVKWRQQGPGLVACFTQIPDRNVAQTMSGTSIWVDKANLPKLDDDEYYWDDLIGFTVINQQKQVLGRVKELFDTGAHPILVVLPSADSIDDEKRLIPWHKQTVVDVLSDGHTLLLDWEADY